MENTSENITHTKSIQIIRNPRFLIYAALLSLLLSTMSAAQINKTKKLLKTDVGLPEPTFVTKKPEVVLATITVTSTADIIDAGGSTCPGVTIASLPGPNGQTSLREAICAANNNPGADIITFAVNGTFALTGAANEDNGTTGDLDLKNSVTVNGNGPANTIINGGGIERIFDFFPAAASTFNLSGVTLQNGDTRVASFKEGGAIYLHNNVTTIITGCQIVNNFSGANGAIENRGTLTINNSVISGNQTIPASGSVVGGGIHNAGQMSIDGTTIDNNSVRGEGGGIATTTAAGVPVTITNSTISNNTASVTGGGLGNGGGISTTGNQGVINITNSTISGNRADNNGGGAYLITPAGGTGNATLTSVTISNNFADNDNNGSGAGGGFAQSVEAVTLRNTIVAGNFNSITSVRDDISGSVISSSSFNLVGDGTGSTGLTNGINSNQVGAGAGAINPQLGPLANNGGPTQTHAIGTNSPGYDKGSAFGSTRDQRGTARPFDNMFVPPAPGGDNSDIGAYESLAPTAAGVRVSGRVTTASGIGIRNAFVYLTRADGTVSTARSSSFGYYSFEEVPAGETCVLSVESKRFTFAAPTRVLAVTDTLAGVDFVAVQ